MWGCVASVNEYLYASTSDVAEAIAESNTMSLELESLLTAREAEVIADLIAIPGSVEFSYTWPLVNQSFLYEGNGDTDLFYAFGKARLDAEVFVVVERTGSSTGVVTTVRLSGVHTDLYDWNYEIAWTDQLTSRLSAVFGVHYVPTGGVYRNRVTFDSNPITAVEGTNCGP